MQINKEPEYEKKPMSKNQMGWIEHFNQKEFIKKGIKMISAPNIYEAIKKKSKVLTSIKKDLKGDYLMTGTRLFSRGVIHNADSKIVKPKEIKVEIPNYSGNFEQDKGAEKYLQALFDTKDSIKQIVDNLESISEGRKLYLWTPSRLKDDQVRAVGLCFSDDRFGVVGYGWFGNYVGLSRGVIMDSASKKQSKSKGKSR